MKEGATCSDSREMHFPSSFAISKPDSLYPISYALTNLGQSSVPCVPTLYRDALQTLLRKPSRWVSLFRESSDSPMARTKPQRAYVWFSPV
jgi:hypothetical protein